MNAVHLAEQATLGALLQTPPAIETVAAWLRAEDFTDPWHRTVYTALLEHARAGDPLAPARLGQVLTDRLGPRAAELPRIHDLIAATPIRPQPVAYARMVLEAAIRERTAVVGLLLRAGALAAAVTGDTRRLAGALDLVTATVNDDESRWATATATTTGAAAHPPEPPVDHAAVRRPAWRDAALGADRALTGHDLDPGLVRDHERALIGALAAHPDQLPQVRPWLRVATVTDPDWRPVYAALLELARAGTGIDAVTVTWQVQACSPRYGPGPGTRAIRDGIEDAATVDVAYAARLVGADLLRRYAEHAATSLRTATGNPGVTVEDVLGTARLMATTLAGLADATPTPGANRRTGLVAAEPAAPQPVPVPRPALMVVR